MDAKYEHVYCAGDEFTTEKAPVVADRMDIGVDPGAENTDRSVIQLTFIY
jgi:hypothetical protein